MSCLLQTHPGVPHHLNQHQAYFLHQPNQPSLIFRYMEGPAEEPATEESLLFQSLTTRSRMSHDTGQDECRRPNFRVETKCHFTSCPPNCDNQSHVVVLGPVSLYTPNDQESSENDPSEPENRVMIKQEPYYDQSNSIRRDQVIFVESCPSTHTVTPTPANSPSKLRPLAPQFGYNNNDFFDVESGVYHQGEQYAHFRSPTSPTESSVASCSSSTLSLLTLMTSTPQRRHSFSATVPNSTSLGSLAMGNSHAGNATSGSSTYRQRSYTYSNSTSKSHPYSLPKRLSTSTTSSQGEGRDYQTSEGFRSICSTSSLSDDHEPQASDHDHEPEPEHEVRSISGGSDSQESEGKKGPAAEPNPCSFLFLGPVGKKRRMVRERQQSLGPDTQGAEEASPEEELSPGSDSTHSQSLKQEVEDIIAEEDEEEEDAQPLNLCLGEEDLERVKRLNINCHGGSTNSVISFQATSPPQQASRNRIPISPQLSGSVLRDHLLSLGGSGEMGSPPSLTGSMSSNSQSQPSPPWLGRAGQPESFNGSASGVASCSTGSPQGAGGKIKKKLKCPICSKEFSQLRNYRYHCSRHAGTDQFACTCPICHKVFNDKGYLGSHMKIHNNKKEYHCEWCEKRFNQRVAYNMHVRIHTGVKPHECHLCTKAFSRKMLLRQHLRTHTGERPYSCEVCGKAFADRSNMLLHQRLHTGQRPYTCTYPKCGKSFSKNHHLKTHLNHHAGIKPYQCEKCLACFSQSSNMKTHFRKCTGTNNSANASGSAPPAGAGGPNLPQSQVGSLNNLASSSSTQPPPFNPRTRTNSLGRQGPTTNYPHVRAYQGPTSPDGAPGMQPGASGPRRRSIPLIDAGRPFDISGIRAPYAYEGTYPSGPPTQIPDYVSIPRTMHQSAAAAASILMYDQGRSMGFPDALIPPTPLASSLPLNFELHTLRSRNPQLFQPLANNPFLAGPAPRERHYDTPSQQTWSNSINYRQPNYSPRKEGP